MRKHDHFPSRLLYPRNNNLHERPRKNSLMETRARKVVSQKLSRSIVRVHFGIPANNRYVTIPFEVGKKFAVRKPRDIPGILCTMRGIPK